MPRVPATNRVAATGRVPAVGRVIIPTQQNFFRYSQEVTEDGFVNYAAGAELSAEVSPLGGQVWEITEDETDDFHGIYQGFLTATGVHGVPPNQMPVFFWAKVKKDVGRYVALDMFLNLGDIFIIADLETGTVIDVDHTEEDAWRVGDLAGGMRAEADGWYTVWITCRITSDYPLNQMSAYVLNSNGEEGYAGIVYIGDGESSVLFGGANFALTNRELPYKFTDGTIFDEGNTRLLIT